MSCVSCKVCGHYSASTVWGVIIVAADAAVVCFLDFLPIYECTVVA
jgi:hypothetical protein